MLRLTKLLLKAVLVLFSDKSGIFQFIRALLSIGEISTHHSLNGPPFKTATYFFEIAAAPCFPVKARRGPRNDPALNHGSGLSFDYTQDRFCAERVFRISDSKFQIPNFRSCII